MKRDSFPKLIKRLYLVCLFAAIHMVRATMRMAEIHRRLQALTKGQVVLLAITLEALIALSDWITGPYISFDPYYFVPIAIATWYLGRTFAYGFVSASVAIRVWLSVPIFPEHYKLIFIANSIMMEAAIFLLVAYLLGQTKTTLERLAAGNARDDLTGLASRNYFLERCSDEMARARRQNSSLALAYADLDNFKLVNDLDGHARGDEVLVRVAKAIKAVIREGDIAGRIGGDEFAFLLPIISQEEVGFLLDRIRRRVADEVASLASPVSISVGAVVYNGDREIGIDELVAQADAEMYKIKRAARSAATVSSLKSAGRTVS